MRARATARRSPWYVRLGLFALALGALTVGFGWAARAADLPGIRDGCPTPWAALPLVAAALVATWIPMSRLDGDGFSALGLVLTPGAARRLFGGIGIGLAVVAVSVGAVALAGWIRWESTGMDPARWGRVGLSLTAFLFLAALWEELLFRGYLLRVLTERFGAVWGVGVTAVAFAAAHGGNPHVVWLGLANTALAGILLGVLMHRTGSLWAVTGLHFAWNWSMGFAAHLPVSGVVLDAPGYRALVSGPDLFTGGTFGPEGGLALTVATLLAVGWVLRPRAPGVDRHGRDRTRASGA
ncbi:MAG: lysostaphin resistance A-like protein [Gemmatimonadota bacterium]